MIRVLVSVLVSNQSSCISLGPEPGYPVVLLSVLQELRCDAPHQRVGGVAVGQKRANTQQHLANKFIFNINK